MKEIRLMSFDLDGTLLKDPGRLSERAEKALRDLKDRNILIVINSGRPLFSLLKIIPAGLIDYAVCQNGQMIWHREDNSTEEMPRLDRSDRRRMLEILKNNYVFLHCTNEEKSYYFVSGNHRVFRLVYLIGRRLFGFLLKNHMYPESVQTDPEIILQWDTPKICFAGFHSDLERIRQDLQDTYSCTFTNRHWLEIMHKGISKGNALKEIIRKENLSPAECAAFGDGENDVDMLAACGLKIAVGNAMPALKEKADLIIGSNTDDGPAGWIEDYLSGSVKL